MLFLKPLESIWEWTLLLNSFWLEMISYIKRFFSKIFSRMVITGIIVLIQIFWILVAVTKLSGYGEIISAVFTLVAAVMALFVIYRNDSGAYKMGWILIITLLPILGTLMYAFFGNKRPSRKLKRIIEEVEAEHKDELRQKDRLGELNDSRLQRTVDYIANQGPYPAWSETKSKYYNLGDKAFPAMLEDIRNAKHFIFMEYFIIENGWMWNEIFRVLKKKVAEGVDVRVIYDDVGSMDKIPYGFYKKLESAGINVVVFNPLRPILNLVYNNRDHRKITVIDGYIGYSGGFNLADEYINKVSRFGHWKDSGIRLEGEAVWNFTVMFLNMWNAYKKTDDDYYKFSPHVHHPDVFDSDGIIQPFSDSPLDSENVSENVYMEIINQAEEYVYIYTPYLILDSEMLSCLQLAARRNVDVRLVTPAIPDKKLIFRLTRSYYQPLIKAGVKIYEYTPGFLHAKSILSDDRIGVVGTINLDYRSLYLHFECGTLMIGSSALRKLKEDCQSTFVRSRKIRIEDTRTNFAGLLFDGVLRVISPLL